jgi:hypothetical protein
VFEYRTPIFRVAPDAGYAVRAHDGARVPAQRTRLPPRCARPRRTDPRRGERPCRFRRRPSSASPSSRAIG